MQEVGKRRVSLVQAVKGECRLFTNYKFLGHMLSLNDERWNGVSEPSSASSLLLKGLRTPGRFLIQYPGKELLVYPKIFWLSPPKPTSAIDSCSHRCAGFSSTGVDDSRELLHPLLPPFNLHNSRVRRASGFLLTAFSNPTPHTFFLALSTHLGIKSEKALA